MNASTTYPNAGGAAAPAKPSDDSRKNNDSDRKDGTPGAPGSGNGSTGSGTASGSTGSGAGSSGSSGNTGSSSGSGSSGMGSGSTGAGSSNTNTDKTSSDTGKADAASGGKDGGGDDVGSQARALRDQVNDTWQTARDVVADKTKVAGAKAREVADNAHAYAREEPWQVAGAALAVGVLIGLMLGRR